MVLHSLRQAAGAVCARLPISVPKCLAERGSLPACVCTQVDFSERPFKVYTDEKEIEAQAVIIATGAVARR